MRNYLIMLFAIVFFATSCATSKKVNMVNEQLTNTKWSLTSFTDNGKETKVTNDRAFMRLDDAKKSIGGNGSCNSFGGSYTINGNNISVSKVFSTKMFCEDVQKTEDSFLRLLETVTKYEVKGKNLLMYNNEKVVLQFSATAE